MAWTIEYAAAARKQLQKLDRQTALRVERYLSERVVASGDPRKLGKKLSGPLGELWRYRVGDFRIIADIQDDRVVVLVLRVAHRRHIYQ